MRTFIYLTFVIAGTGAAVLADPQLVPIQPRPATPADTPPAPAAIPPGSPVPAPVATDPAPPGVFEETPRVRPLGRLFPLLPGSQPLPPPIPGGTQWVEGANLVLVVSADQRHAWGYSEQKGEWNKVDLEPQQTTPQPIGPTVAGDVAYISTGRFIYAYSGPKGQWERLEVRQPPNALYATQTRIVAMQGTTVSIFSAQSGKWATAKFDER